MERKRGWHQFVHGFTENRESGLNEKPCLPHYQIKKVLFRGDVRARGQRNATRRESADVRPVKQADEVPRVAVGTEVGLESADVTNRAQLGS